MSEYDKSPIKMNKSTNKDGSFVGKGRSLQSYIDQTNAETEKTIPMNSKD